MMKILLILELKELLDIIDKLNYCGKCLFIKENDLLMSMITVLSNQNYNNLSIYDKVDIVIDYLSLNDTLDIDPIFAERLRSNFYSALSELNIKLNEYRLISKSLDIKYFNRINKSQIILRVYNNV